MSDNEGNFKLFAVSLSFVLSVTHNPFMMSVIMLSVIMLNVIMLNVVMLKVVAPTNNRRRKFLLQPN
jgi:hypothetical protein